MLCASITSLFILSIEGEQEITVKAAMIPAVIYKKLSKQDSCKEDSCATDRLRIMGEAVRLVLLPKYSQGTSPY
jgi:hypothetical protein